MSEFLKTYIRQRKRTLKTHKKNVERVQAGGCGENSKFYRPKKRSSIKGRKFRLVGM